MTGLSDGRSCRWLTSPTVIDVTGLSDGRSCRWLTSLTIVDVTGLSEGSKRTLVKEEDGHARINVSLLEHLVMSSEVRLQAVENDFKLSLD